MSLVDGSVDARQQLGASPPRGRRRVVIVVAVLLGIALTLAGIRALLVQVYYIPSGSMEQTLRLGDRVLVDKLSYRIGSIERGDIVVFDGSASWDAPSASGQPSPSEGSEYIKRVIGLPGDRVRCCDSDGRLVVNGSPLDEPYLYPGDVASVDPFDIRVADGMLWVMGDHRSESADSRAHIGDPGGGGVPVDSVVGKAVAVLWPWSERGTL